ncbi:thymidine kinase [Sphingomonas sp. CGMCC 1.13654]|uniref:Thymidine kinase n=1 Tax=Sphingomonas chungangi TaxID=2683589 RepID=A0A838L9H4_9SPHN|nr:thymidine kinase [Sphingomonas chungangi]MBA2934776.1 thymidine kinase [Sphingomonas chungangi]MVW58087.1 thymidine kinase [Sphingomonas chungangi]
MAKLYFYYSAMNAGKSTQLLQSAFNYAERGMRTLLFTAGVHDRGGHGVIDSRIGLKAEATPFDTATDLHAEVSDARQGGAVGCVLIDEAQFLTRAQALQLARVCDEMGVPVLCYGLRTDFRAELFEGSAALLALADILSEIKTVCNCGRKATMNLRIDEHGNAITVGDQIGIGGNDRYIALCRRHYMERIRG